MSVLDKYWKLIQIAAVVLGLLLGGFKLTAAVQLNTASGEAQIKAYQSIEGRVTDLEAWRYYEQGKAAAIAEMKVHGPEAGDNAD